jgi:hypothetical protein
MVRSHHSGRSMDKEELLEGNKGDPDWNPVRSQEMQESHIGKRGGR